MSQPKPYRFKYTTEQAADIREALERDGFARKTKWRVLIKEITRIAHIASSI